MQTLLSLTSLAARQTQQAQALLANNLANADTTGFKADLYQAQSSYLEGGVYPSGVAMASGNARVDFERGNIVYTGRDLDVAITNDGWFQVVSPEGEPVLSRRGDLRVDPNGLLLDGEGNQVMGETGPIALPPFSSMSIGADGTISIVPLGEAPNAVTALDRLMLVNPPVDTLYKGADGAIRSNDPEGLLPAAEVNIAVGAIESSNVNPAAIMVEMIQLSREFEGHVKAMKTVDELNTSSSRLMKME